MGAIAKQFFLASPVLDFPLIALATFLVVFVVITIRTLAQKTATIDAAARLPFDDARNNGAGHG